MRNYIRLFSHKDYVEYAFFDLPERQANHIFILHKLSVVFLKEIGRSGFDYFIIVCRVKAEDKAVFEKCIEELRDTMLLCGRTDYDKFCAEMGGVIEKGCA